MAELKTKIISIILGFMTFLPQKIKSSKKVQVVLSHPAIAILSG